MLLGGERAGLRQVSRHRIATLACTLTPLAHTPLRVHAPLARFAVTQLGFRPHPTRPRDCHPLTALRYHDEEWGRRVAHTEDQLYERLTLEGFQAGLSWLTILRKRDNFRKVRAISQGVVVPTTEHVHCSVAHKECR